MKRTTVLVILAIILCGCVSTRDKKNSGTERPEQVHFQVPAPPSIYQDGEERNLWLLEHWWDECFAKPGKTDSTSILGIAKPEMEQALANYIQLLNSVPLEKAQNAEKVWFGKLEKMQAGQPEESTAFLRYTELVAKYLYDPNSPLRDEDLFLPFVQGLAESPYTSEDMRPGYKYQAEMCSLNRRGTSAPDFSFLDSSGKRHTLYGERAEYTILFFSNPGCTACKEIIDELQGRPWMDSRIADGTVAVVNVYIDDEIDAWRQYEPNYPENWICGYDPDGTVRGDQLYDVRAIPSLYLLDRDKKILMKDAPTEKVLLYLDKVQNDKQQNPNI